MTTSAVRLSDDRPLLSSGPSDPRPRPKMKETPVRQLVARTAVQLSDDVNSTYAQHMDKTELVHHLGSLLADKSEAVRAEIIGTRDSFTSDTKSSAGDKHEVGRAMIQQELDKLEEQRAKLLSLQQELARVPLDRVFDRAAFGSLIGTDQGMYFLAIGLGRVELKGLSCAVISLASPLGLALKDKQVGDQVAFNGTQIVIRTIA